ncbi:hypothetical protein J5Y09_03430 [Roseomonas sp. PWR1]|uniref:DUF4347 domain-containing protein n=1 Tax=Roseomonas nitratireducens TaxID=2820810 RepID=A0ABS4ANM0_9PROT|nr:hypothetical protein [Neoroseomonas nitratireducens]MBP0462951.1 hypothetical protein [Neoroseomonas nitratireducens]
MTSMILHDSRLEGRTPRGYDYTFVVDGGTPLREAIGMVHANATMRRLDVLHVFCHGIEIPADMARGLSTNVPHGGFGLVLCGENLDLRNVSLTHRWRGLVGQIVIFACATAAVGPGNRMTRGDGQRFCAELAAWTGAEVIAGRDVQRYTRGAETFWTRIGFAQTSPIDFGGWEGPVYRFRPGDTRGTEFRPRPMNMGAPGVI